MQKSWKSKRHYKDGKDGHPKVSFGKMTATQIRKNPKMLTIDFSFRELEIFCKVVELESFSKAAEAVFLVQASVSERIASLE